MTLPSGSNFLPIIQGFGKSVTRAFKSTTAGQPEEQLKTPVQTLLKGFGQAMNLTIDTVPESRIAGAGRPDIAVEESGLLNGYVELKAPGTGASANKFSGRNKKQWQKFSAAIPNLLYTDGDEWVLYRTGKQTTRVVLAGNVKTDGAGAANQTNADDLFKLLRDFFSWDPIVPKTLKELAALLAPLCHVLREDVERALAEPNSNLRTLAQTWRRVLFPDANDEQFADAYAQTMTYALLLARFEMTSGAAFDVRQAATALQSDHDLLAEALDLLGHRSVREEISVGIALLERSIGAVDPNVTKTTSDPWLYFYEDFLAAYDKKLRNDRGVYYTPHQVVKAQVNLVSELLVNKFGKRTSFAERDVVVLDPAAGTGTYPLAVLEHGLNLVSSYRGSGQVASSASTMASNVYAFEILAGPYTVAHLKFGGRVKAVGGTLPSDGARVYLTDTLASSTGNSTPDLFGSLRRLGEEQKRAQEVKNDTRVLVCIGNPPYDREQITPSARASATQANPERKGGWVRHGDDGKGANAILEQFLEPARKAGAGIHIKNLYNDYVYFWRWALWKVFEKTKGAGIVSFITASSYLRGPGFVGIRQVMRETFDEMWIIDLEGDSLGARKTQNIFAIRTPVAIAVGVRYGDPDPATPARVRYAKITGSRDTKLAELDNVSSFGDLAWKDCMDGWQEPLLPEGAGDYFSWPLVTDIFPWQHSGVQMKRKWPIGETEKLLERRWRGLLSADDRVNAYRESRDRKIGKRYVDLEDPSKRLEPISALPEDAPLPEVASYAYRSFDRQKIIKDARLGDFMRPELWRAHGPDQVYLTSLLTKVLGLGPAATVSSAVPDLDHFSGRGGKDVIPLWRDASATQANVTAGLLDTLSAHYGESVSPEDLFTYAYALLGTPAYVDRFSEELATPGPRLPLTKDKDLFRRGVELGREAIFLHTYAERFVPAGKAQGAIPQGRARSTKAIPDAPDEYPNEFDYYPQRKTLAVGKGEIAPVDKGVWEFEVSGLKVLRSWLGYRMLEAAGRSSSPLDKERPERWTPEMTDELLDLIWALEATLKTEPSRMALLDQIVASEMFTDDELPDPTAEERKSPKARSSEHLEQESLMATNQ